MTSSYPINRSDTEWAQLLNPKEFAVLRRGGTEPPGVGEYTDTTTEGVYSCRACGAELFRSDTKFASHCGWPSFYAPLAGDAVEYVEDTSLGMKRVEVRCAEEIQEQGLTVALEELSSEVIELSIPS